MPEVDDVRIGETIAVEWGNAIRDRTIQRYADAAERAELHPNPTEGDLSYLEDTNSIEVFDGFAWVAGIPNQAVTTAKIADHAVTTTKIGDLAVTTDKIDTHAVTTTKIGDLAVTTPKIAEGAVTTPKIADQAVTGPKIANGAVTFSKIADSSVGAAKITGAAISAFERSGATVETNVWASSSVSTLATVTLNIPSSWSSWNCVAFAQSSGAGAFDELRHLGLRISIDGTDGYLFDYHVPGGATAVAAAAFRSGITTTGNRTIALRGNTFSGGDIFLSPVFLYARAFRTS